jgi:hypothetical protein
MFEMHTFIFLNPGCFQYAFSCCYLIYKNETVILCSAERLKNVVIQLDETLPTLTTVATHKTVIGVDCTFRFEIPVKGRYLKIMLETSGEYLQITELEVYSNTETGN